MNKITISLGTLSGLLLLAGFLGPLAGTDFSHLSPEDYNQGESLGYGVMLLAAAGAIVAMVVVSRRNAEAGFGQLIKTGLATAVVTTLVFYVGNVIFYRWIAPDFLGHFMDAFAVNKAKTITDEAKRAAYLAGMESDKTLYTNPFLYSGIMAGTVFMICLMPVAVFGYILFRIRNRRRTVQ